MPLSCDEEFLARVQRYGRVQVPVLIRWKHKLEPGEVLSVYVKCSKKFGSESFYAKMSKDYRFTIPKIVVQELEIEHGDVLEVTLHAQTKQKE